MSTLMIKVKMSRLRVDYYVRLGTDPDRVAQFAERYIGEGEKALPPIQVHQDANNHDIFIIDDGRTRFEAMQLVNTLEPGFFDEIVVEMLPVMSGVQYRFHAIKANTGGAMPATIPDIRKSVTDLMNQGVSRQKIIAELGKDLGVRVVQQACDYAQSNIAQAKMNQAIAAVNRSEMTIAQAAKHFGVNEENLKNKQADKPVHVQSKSAAIKQKLAGHYKKTTLVFGSSLRHLAKDVMDGIAKPSDFAEVLHYAEMEIGKQRTQINAWRERANEFGSVEAVKTKRKSA